MSRSAQHLRPAEAARRLGLSQKALRLYEQRGLVRPGRTAAGWRTYGPADTARAAEIATLRALGLSLAEVAHALGGDPGRLEAALAAHQAMLEGQARQLAGAVERLSALRSELAQGRAPAIGGLASRADRIAEAALAFALPWPWGGERFELGDMRPLNHVIGPLGSGKTRLAHAIADILPGARFIGLDRLADGGAEARATIGADPALTSRVDQALARLVADGATTSPALIALLAAFEGDGAGGLVVDMVEQGLEQSSQQALIAHLRRRGPGARPLFLLTRSSAILDLGRVTPYEAIIFCPANHSPPTRVAPYPGAPGYEAVATCLASPEVRARTEGVVAWRPEAA